MSRSELGNRLRRVAIEMENVDYAWCLQSWISELEDIALEMDQYAN